MNLFDKITWKSSVQWFLGTNPAEQAPSFMKTPVAPMTQSYVAPVKKPYTLYSDEQSAYDRMIADKIPESDIMDTIKSRRQDLLWWDARVSKFELEALKKMQADWMSSSDATQALLEHRKEMQQEEQKRYESMWKTEKVVKWAVWASLWAVSTIASSSENILGWWAKKIGFDSLWEELQKSAQEWKQASTDLWKSPEYSAWVTTGNVIGWAGMIASVPWTTWLLWKWAWLLPRVIAWAWEWALQSTGMDIAWKWETSLKSAITWGVVWWLFPVVWTWLWKAKEFVTNKIPKSLISAWLTTPSKLLNASERLSRLSDEWMVNAWDAPQWLLDKWIQGSKETIQKQLTWIAQDAGKQKVQLFAKDLENWVQKTYENAPVVKELQQALLEVLPNFAKVTSSEIVPKAWNADKVTALLEFVTKPKPTALDVDKARAVLWDMGIFTKGWELADTATKEWLQKVWINASKLLDESLPWFRNLNKDIEVSHAIGKAMWLKEAQDSVRQLMTLTNLGAGWAWAAYWYAQEWDVAGALKYAGAWLAGKYLFNNPAVTTFVAQKLKDLWKPWLISKVVKSPAGQKLIRSQAINLSK